MTGSLERFARPCSPPWWARGGHAQTVWGHVLPCRAPRFDAESGVTRAVKLADGERLVVHERAGTSSLRVLLFHGLSGDANADYVRRAALALGRRGHGVWAVEHRGCGAGEGLAVRPYHSGSKDDLGAVIAASRADRPDLTHVVVGFSLSGNAALLLAGSHDVDPDALPDGVVAVSPPVDIGVTSRALHVGFARLYEWRFVQRLRRVVHRRVRAGVTRRAYRIPRGASLCEFDDLFTAPEAGFASGEDYYARCSTLERLDALRVPTAIVTAGDDPFVHPDVYARAPELPPHVLLHVEPHGGHVGWVEGLTKRWIDPALVHYVGEVATSASAGSP